MHTSERDIIDLVDMIWSTTLGMAIRPILESERDGWTLPAVEAQVHIAGTWRGAVVLHTSETLAERIAQKMFGMDSDRRRPTPEDKQDAFGEVANITGGNIKGLLSEGDAYLSLPAVVQGLNYSVRVPGSRQLWRLEFVCEGEPLVVTILQADAIHGVDAGANGTAARRGASAPTP
jgi:chemotaxis protein CheX